jgi:hypothetical protein
MCMLPFVLLSHVASFNTLIPNLVLVDRAALETPLGTFDQSECVSSPRRSELMLSSRMIFSTTRIDLAEKHSSNRYRL